MGGYDDDAVGGWRLVVWQSVLQALAGCSVKYRGFRVGRKDSLTSALSRVVDEMCEIRDGEIDDGMLAGEREILLKPSTGFLFPAPFAPFLIVYSSPCFNSLPSLGTQDSLVLPGAPNLGSGWRLAAA